MLVSFYNDDPPSDPAFQTLTGDNLLARLQALDSRANRKGLDSLDPTRNRLIRMGMEIEAGAVVKNGYGVFDLSWQAEKHPEWPDRIDAEIGEIRQRIATAHNTRLQFLIWAGVGGSAEDKNAYNTTGLLKGGPRCYVLDSTDPAKLKAILEDMARRSTRRMPAILKSTLAVGMATSMTSYEPVVNLEKLSLLFDKHAIDPRPNFCCLALPGSLLDRFASARGYRRMELQLDDRNSTAGRHSSPLTRGSLYPLGLAGANLSAWISATFLNEEEIYSAWRLSAFLHTQGLAGRDKVTLMIPDEWAGAALWTKQDFEESLGKSERWGIKIISEENIKLPNYRPPKDPWQDRLFLAIQARDLTNPDPQKIALLRRSGYPVVTVAAPRGALLSHYMQWMHYAVFGIAYLRDMNFVTQPGVELYQAHAGRLVASAEKSGGLEKSPAWREFQKSPHQARWRGRLTLHYGTLASPTPVPEIDPLPSLGPEIYATLLSRLASARDVEYGELTFFGDTRYSLPGRALRKTLNRAAETLFRAGLRMPVDVYEGPAVNHTYHEMIIGHGKCFSTLLIAESHESIREIGYTADHHRAQFLATLLALAGRNRPVVALALKDLGDGTLGALEEFFRQAAKHVTLLRGHGETQTGGRTKEI